MRARSRPSATATSRAVLVLARGGEELAVRAERHRRDRAVVGDAGALAAVRHRHQPRRLVRPARGGEGLAVRAERHRRDRAVVGDAGEGSDQGNALHGVPSVACLP